MRTESEIRNELASLETALGKLNDKYFGRSVPDSYHINKRKLLAKISILEWILEESA